MLVAVGLLFGCDLCAQEPAAKSVKPNIVSDAERGKQNPADSESEAAAVKGITPYKNGFPPPAPNPKVKTKIELVKNAQGLLVRSEKSYQEAQDHVARYLEGTYLKKLRQHYPKQKEVQVKVAKNPSAEGLLVHENLIYARWGKRAMVLDLYLPAKHDGPLPVVIWVHGGGWQWGSHRTYRSAAMKFVWNIDWLAKRHFPRRSMT
jgi:hypothetical protein